MSVDLTPMVEVPAALSPSLRADRKDGPAFELKFQMPASAAERIEAWAFQHLTPDPHGEQGRYRTTSLYCDTPAFDVFQRSPGFRRSKFRLRRYGASALIYLERKSKRGDEVSKRRSSVPEHELTLLSTGTVDPAWPAFWFSRRIDQRQLQPTCCVSYDRTAFLGHTSDGPIRLTFDRHLIGVPASEWQVPMVQNGRSLLPDQVLVELKFQARLPGLFRELLPLLPSNLARASKFRLCIQAWELAATPAPRAST